MAVVALAFSPDETLLASASADKTAKVWNPFQGICVWTLEGHTKVCPALLTPHVCISAICSTFCRPAVHNCGQFDIPLLHSSQALQLTIAETHLLCVEDLNDFKILNKASCCRASASARSHQYLWWE